MRLVLVLSLAALLVSSAAAAISQSDARALEDRWSNCSKVVNGRLGALHPVADGPWAFMINETLASDNTTRPVSGGEAFYSPCATVVQTTSGRWRYTEDGGAYFLKVTRDGDTFTFNQSVLDDGRVATFSMPEKKGDKPKFIATYTGVRTSWDKGDAKFKAVVTTICSGRPAFLEWNVDEKHHTVQAKFLSPEACSRFPYSNKSVPPGGVAAIVITILLFLIQFGICGWYHKTQAVEENPFTAGEFEQCE